MIGDHRIGCRFVLIVVAVCVLGCGDDPPPLNLLLVTLDTTRADHLGCYGKESAGTPTLDWLAADGVRFSRCFTAAPVTTPSHATILTGTYPPYHGVRDNGLFVLGPGSLTLAEIMKDRGYATGAVVGAFPVTRQFGLAQGFDVFDDHISVAAEDFRGQRVVPRQGLFFEERPAAWVNSAILPWLEDHLGASFFIWLHYWDPHLPHQPPPPYSELFANDLYQGEIAYADHSLGRIITRLRDAGVLERTVVIVVGDHGEGLGDHGEDTHSMLAYNSTIRVPFIMRVPGRFSGRTVDQPVGTVDILPTVVDLLGIELPEGVQGRSLVPILNGGEDESGGSSRRYYSEALSGRLSHGWGELRVLFGDGYKYIHGPRPELYALDADPEERQNLIGELPSVAANLEEELREMIVALGAAKVGAIDNTPDDEAIRQLEALGYLTTDGDRSGLDVEKLRTGGDPPQDRVGDIGLMSRAKQAIDDGDYLSARESSIRLLELDPDSAFYSGLLATAYLGLDQTHEALEVMERLEVLESRAAGVVLDIGVAAFNAGEQARGEAIIRRLLAEQPSAYGFYLLAEMRASVGDDAEYAEMLDRSLEMDHDYSRSLLSSAIRSAGVGEPERAELAFKHLLGSHPYHLRGHFNYGVFLLQQSRWNEALHQLEAAVELSPEYWPARLAVLAMHVDRGDVQSARSVADVILNRCPDPAARERAEELIGML